MTMKKFIGKNFMLNTKTAKKLYHEYAKMMPIVDYHCHINPQEIAEDRKFENITQVWLEGDHYKWRLIRANGEPEDKVTVAGEKDPYALFKAFAAALPRAVGNPVYHWTHLELERYFNIEIPLNPDTAQMIYNACNEKLQEPNMSVRGLIAQSNVKLICTTDDPIATLDIHTEIAQDSTCDVKVLPAFRPDKAIHLEKPGFADYISMLGDKAGIPISDFKTLCDALTGRIDHFEKMGCRASDHALEHCVFRPATPERLEEILHKALTGESITEEEAEQYHTAVLLHLAREYRKRGWVMQLHFGCLRDTNTRMYQSLGPDTGFDAMNGQGAPYRLAQFLDKLEETRQLPKMILYSLNPGESEILASIAGCFMADAECPGKIQLGAAWWFNDTISGMEKQLQDYANSTLLGNFVGMLTDSRSFLSYTRHEYFRRILCNFIGQMVEDGKYPADYQFLGSLIEDICYNNTVRFFGFEV